MPLKQFNERLSNMLGMLHPYKHEYITDTACEAGIMGTSISDHYENGNFIKIEYTFIYIKYIYKFNSRLSNESLDFVYNLKTRNMLLLGFKE